MHEIVFLFDVDNTLLDNDHVQADFACTLPPNTGRTHDRYWALFEDLRSELGYADYLGALQRYRLEELHNPRVLRIANWLVDYPFADRLYPRRWRRCAMCGVGPHGDPVRRRRRVPAAQGRALRPVAAHSRTTC